MTVAYASNRVTITGSHKSGTTTAAASASTFQITSGEIVSGDVGRLVALVPSTTDSSQTQVRRIESVSGTTVTVHDDWVGSIASGTAWRVAHNLEDVHAIGDAALRKVGERSYQWDADWVLNSDAFLGDLDVSLEMISQTTSNNFDAHWKANDSAIVQFGLLWGGEANGAEEVTNGCHISMAVLSGTDRANTYNKDNSRSANGAVINYYGCLINSVHADGGDSTNNWMFQRMRGPTRFIGCIQDGIAGGRFYHEASEWVNCVVTGNNNLIPAFSLGVSLTRDISGCRWGQNLVAVKSLGSFVGTFRDCLFFDSNDDFFFVNGSTSAAVIAFIDCTTITDDKIVDSGSNTLRQSKSVNFTMTDSSGAALSGVALRVNDNQDNTQGSVQISDGAGVCAEVLARFNDWVDAGPSTDFSPFRIRIRKYGNLWTSLASDIADPIRQSFALLDDANVSQTEGVAQAHTGITLTDHGGSPVSWNSKNWGITVTGNLTTNPSLSADDIKHYLHYHLAQSAAFQGKGSGLEWHNLAPMSGNETQTGDYAGTIKGVRVVDESGNPFPGFDRFQADDGTYYLPPATVTIAVTVVDETGSPIENARVRVTATESVGSITNGDVVLAGLTDASGVVEDTAFNYENAFYPSGLDIKIKVRQGKTSPFKKPFEGTGVITASGFRTTIALLSDE